MEEKELLKNKCKPGKANKQHPCRQLHWNLKLSPNCVNLHSWSMLSQWNQLLKNQLIQTQANIRKHLLKIASLKRKDKHEIPRARVSRFKIHILCQR